MYKPASLIFQLDDYLHEQELETLETTSKVIPPRVLAEAFISLAVIPNVDAGDAVQVAMQTLVDAHHPSIGGY